MALRVLVCGGRDYDDRGVVWNTLAAFMPSVVIEGGALGADRHAQDWAYIQGIPCETFLADWDRHGKSAGPKRNQTMLEEGNPDLVIAFPGGRGTADMVRRAKAAGVEVREIA